MISDKVKASRLRRRHRVAEIANGPIGPPPPAAYYSEKHHIPDCFWVPVPEVDISHGIVWAHHVDHSPEVESWGIEELIFAATYNLPAAYIRADGDKRRRVH